jgi:hypothetical protein
MKRSMEVSVMEKAKLITLPMELPGIITLTSPMPRQWDSTGPYQRPDRESSARLNALSIRIRMREKGWDKVMDALVMSTIKEGILNEGNL